MSDNNKKEKNSKKNDKKKFIISLIITIVLLVLVAASGVFYYFKVFKAKNEENPKEMAYTELIKSIGENSIEKIKMTTGSGTITVTVKGEGEEKDREKTVLVPSVQAFMEWVQEKIDTEKLDIELIQENVNPFLRIIETIFSFLPTILLVVLMFMIIQMQGLGANSAKVYGGEDGEDSDVRFDDIAGLDEEKGELEEIVDFLKNPKEYVRMGAKVPRGVLLYGKPGTGKTLIAKAIAGEAGVPFISMSGSEFIEMFAGLGA